MSGARVAAPRSTPGWLFVLVSLVLCLVAPLSGVRAQPEPATPEDTTQPGLLAFWSAGVSHATNLGQVDWSKYTNVTVEAQINWPNTNAEFYTGGPTDYFALQLVGKVEIPSDGTWTFGVSSDAGARLFIDGHLVVNDDANHSFRRQSGSIALTAGRHNIEVRYLEIYYSQGLVLDWSGPGVSTATTVPASAFRHDPAQASVTDPGHGLRAYWSNAVSHATKLGEVDWTTYVLRGRADGLLRAQAQGKHRDPGERELDLQAGERRGRPPVHRRAARRERRRESLVPIPVGHDLAHGGHAHVRGALPRDLLLAGAGLHMEGAERIV